MIQVLLYFIFDFLGLFVALIFYKLKPKVKTNQHIFKNRQFQPLPMDYTTIPGMKLKVERAEDLPVISIDPGENPMLIHLSKGHMRKIQRCKDRFILTFINFQISNIPAISRVFIFDLWWFKFILLGSTIRSYYWRFKISE